MRTFGLMTTPCPIRAPNRRRSRRFRPLSGRAPLSKNSKLTKYQIERTTAPRPGSYSGLAKRERSTQAPCAGGWALGARAAAGAELSCGNGLTSRTKRRLLERGNAAGDGVEVHVL